MSDCQSCGTGGGGSVVLPSDPDNNIALSARTVYGGISVSWTWPTINESAVAQTIIYRGSTNNPSAMIELNRTGGSLYFDSLDPATDTTYYYWIQIVSINGTRLDKVGPVSAVARSRSTQTLESLTGLIDAGVLAQSLKEDIAGITTLGNDLIREIDERVAANTALSGLIDQVNTGLTQAMTYLTTEITQRTDGDSAIVSQLTTMAAATQNNLALLFQEQTVRANADSAMAQQITTLSSQTSGFRAALDSEITTRTTQDSALSSRIDTLTTNYNNISATVRDETTARVNGDSALASRITTAETSLNGNIATVQTNMQTQINTQNGKITGIGALYTAKVQVNGLIGGFGVYNDGTSVEAGFDVDRFWIGRTNDAKVKPFIVDNGIVYIDKAKIREADIDTLKIAGNAVTNVLSSYIAGTVFTLANVKITATTIGAPVILTFGAQILFSDDASTEAYYMLKLNRDGITIRAITIGRFGSGDHSIQVVDNPGTGSHTYTLTAEANTGGSVIQVGYPFITYIEAKR